ncbi:22075_t:CDS:2 [Cetraspora pellucida]|uniref:22075_t:CDS:1 n=1 Tax=Cetraspora pellucida TaxID=1433469 RepID=A0A9N9FA01_9GLOM|nr:22075_t:CDS:2 [Cetraspora pellucida]
MVTQIDTYFLDIDTLIKSQFEDNVQNNSQVEQKFKEAIILINEIDDENQHKSYKYKYHKTYHSYLTVIGDVEGANRHEKLAKNCEKYLNTHAEERQPILYTDDVVSNTVNQDCYLERKISEELKQIRPILKDELIEIEVVDTLIKEISRVFEKLSNVAKTFEGYQEAIDCEIYMNRLVDSLIHERLIVLKASSNSENGLADKSSKVKNISTELIEHLRCLEAFAHDAAYSKRTEIVSFLSDSSNKIGILFRNVINTEEEINKRARVLCSWFHPDKTKNSKSPYVLRDKHKSQADELFKLVLGFKEHLLNKLKKTLEIEDYEKYGHELWKTAIDYNHAFRGRWNKLKMLKEDNIKELSQESLELNSKIMGELAYHQYRAACKIADKAKLLKIQVKLRGYMALCLYFTNQSLEAPLYALAAILLQVKNSSNFTQQELDDAKNILDKVNSRKEERENSEEGVSSNSTTDIKLENDLNNAMALIRTYDKEISLSNKAFIQNSINKNLINTATKLLVKAERRLVCLEASLNEISNTKQHAKEYKAKGVVVTASGGVVGSAAFLNAGLNFALCGPIGLFAGATCLVVGLCYGYYLFKKGEEMFKEPKIRENLNKIINEALSAYDKEKYQKFIDILSEEYDENKRLLNFHDKVGIVGIDIINTLKTHGFRSDGIAYLLVVLGEVLGSGKINIEGVTHAVLKADAKKLFRMALDEELVKEAEELDKCTSQLRQTNLGSLERYLKSTCGKIKDFVLSEERTRLALEYLQDSQEMPFFSRLEEVRNIAKINIAILNIIEYDDDAYKEAKQTVEEVRKSVKENYQFIIKSKLRLEVLEDFLWVINGEDLSDSNGDLSEPSNTSLLITFNTTMKTDPKLDDKYINYLNNQRSFNQNKYYEAIYFEYLAKKEAKINKLNSLRYWQSAQENYEIARGIDSSNLLYSLGYARCLLKLSKYTQVIKLSDTCPALNSSSEYWHFRSVAYFKQKKYEDAISCNSEALKLDPGNNSAGKHRELIKKLNVNNVVRNRINRYKKELIYETDYLKNSYCDERPVYNILSIDGGGIRGALPALWLSELEYRTRRPIAHLFNMIAGTSTGGIIAAGLSAPQFKPIFMTDERIEYQHSNLIPIFSASDLLNIYRNGSKNLFTKSTSWFKVPIWSKVQNKYTDEGRSTIFKQYFEEVRICHSLTELVIPAANENYTHLFNRYDARKNSRNAMINNTFVDMLMATTAAPTFFPPYKIGNKNFIDGGIHLNNPASTAYSEAIRYNVPDERISVLSLGTGCYLPDPSNPDQYNLLFWAQNLPQFMISAQESNTDREMYTKLKNRYQRWQVFLEEPIELDDHEGINNLLELGYQHIEELDCSDENPINKLMQAFEDVWLRPIDVLSHQKSHNVVGHNI